MSTIPTELSAETPVIGGETVVVSEHPWLAIGIAAVCVFIFAATTGFYIL